MHARKTLLFNQNSTWAKRNDSECSFDVAMGAYDSADICNLIGFYILDDLGSKFTCILFDLHRNDPLDISRGANGHTLDKFRRDIIHTPTTLFLK